MVRAFYDMIISNKYYFLTALLLILSTIIPSYGKDSLMLGKNGQELLLCRKCGADVADSYYTFSKSSPGARKTEKQDLFGQKNVTTQLLVNPFGVQFQVLTTRKARCNNLGPPQGADSWFPGYVWQICTCPHCGQHLGWTFERNSSRNDDENEVEPQIFHGLILKNILGENFTDSLIMIPKSYGM